ncbi:MAG: hypothetical protein MIO92_05235, partial [Methanosarcinaceae archaeon]|nr:hypothetical protein [Methanosarcinaceae archaeon]
DTNKISVVCLYGTTTVLVESIITGTNSINFGTPITIATSATYSCICRHNTSFVSMAFRGTSNYGQARAAEFSYTDAFTWQDETTFHSGSTAYVSLCVPIANTPVVAFSDASLGSKGVTTGVTNPNLITVSGGTWSASWPDQAYYIKFGTTEIDGTGSPDTWYLVGDFVNTTQCTLLELLAPQSAVTYIIRQDFSSTATDYHDFCNVIDDLTAQDEWIVTTNQVEPPLYYDGTTAYLQTLGGSPPYAKYCLPYYGHLLLGNCIDSTSTYQLPQTIYWSARGDPADWSGAGYGYIDLLDNDDEITGMEILKQRCYVFKSHSIVECQFTGSVDPVFNFIEDKVKNVGAPCGRTVVNLGEQIIFLGADNVYSFNGFQIFPVGDPVIDEILSTLDTRYDYKSVAFSLPTKWLYCLFITPVDADIAEPTKAYVYNYVKGSWTIWEFEDSVSAVCTMNDYSLLFGTPQGNVYIMDFVDTDDNGTDIDSYIETKDYEFLSEAIGRFAARVQETVLRLADKENTLQISCSMDYGTTWSLPVVVTQNITTAVKEHVQNWLQRGKEVRFKIENIDGSEFEIESFEIGIENAGLNFRR